MKAPKLKKILEIKECHGKKWEDNYSWIHQKNILDVLKDSSKLDKKVRNYLEAENKYTDYHLKKTIKLQSEPYKVKVEKNKTYFWCSCGFSKKQAFCDSSHKKEGKFKPIKYLASFDKEVL